MASDIRYVTKGPYIVDAVSGARYPYLVGSHDEKRFYKVIDASITSGKNTMTYFYASPEKYEQARCVELNETRKNDWHSRFAGYTAKRPATIRPSFTITTFDGEK